MGLIERLLKNSTSDYTDTIADSQMFKQKDFAPTLVPVVNLVMSGSFKGGITRGHTVFAGESKHFKTAFLMLCGRAFLDKYPDGIILFYDTEFGAPQDYFKTFGIPMEKVIHTPIFNIEEMIHDCMTQLQEIKPEDHVIVLVDSFGNMASKKEIEDALKGEDKADMQRAKKLKSLFRMIVMQLNAKDIPMISAGHTYKTLEMYSKQILSGGTGYYYGANDIFFIGRNQEKNEATKEIEGYNFVINVEKSRFVREKLKVEIAVTFDGGINMWSGLLELALESGHVIKPKQGWYQVAGKEGKSFREADTNSAAFWLPILDNQSFVDFVENKFRLAKGEIIRDITDEEIEEDMKNA
jgi:hypothetical protein